MANVGEIHFPAERLVNWKNNYQSWDVSKPFESIDDGGVSG
jgi:hypothetical protein